MSPYLIKAMRKIYVFLFVTNLPFILCGFNWWRINWRYGKKNFELLQLIIPEIMRILLAFSYFPTYSEIWSPPVLPLTQLYYLSNIFCNRVSSLSLSFLSGIRGIPLLVKNIICLRLLKEKVCLLLYIFFCIFVAYLMVLYLAPPISSVKCSSPVSDDRFWSMDQYIMKLLNPLVTHPTKATHSW